MINYDSKHRFERHLCNLGNKQIFYNSGGSGRDGYIFYNNGGLS